ncbi:MAG: aspartate carbamoyltransferase [Termitinemataceae bacterium]|nr:MAG: aspartate carbamoyltransferase [Termitinemataceae bacterium]
MGSLQGGVMLKGRHLIEPSDFSVSQIESLFALTKRIIEDKKYLRESCKGRLMASLFFEPSTRTRLSFEAAMLRLGGNVMGFSDASSSSASKGESLADTITVVQSYVDLIVMRNPKEGSALLASRYSNVPVINAGDGGHHHPTQTLTDLVTINQLRGNIENITVGFCGDLKFGRTVHSLAEALSRYAKIKMIFISPSELKVPSYITQDILCKKNIEFCETDRLEKVIEDLDVLYMTRVQRERFLNEEEYVRLKDSYILTQEKLALAKSDMLVMHPLPRVNEIAVEVDKDKRASYFKQAEFGMYVRMALIASLLGEV